MNCRDLQNAQTLAALSTRLGWNAYYSLLSTLLKLVSRKAHLTSYLIKIVCSLLRRFPFTAITQLASRETAAVVQANELKEEEQANIKKENQKRGTDEDTKIEEVDEEGEEEDKAEVDKQDENEATLSDIEKANKVGQPPI